MLKVAVLLLVFTRTDSVITGGWTDWHRVEDKEKDMLQEIKASFRNKTSGLKHYDTRHADLLQKASYDNIRFQTQLVAGINYRFKITTNDLNTPTIFLVVFEGLYTNPGIKATYLGTNARAIE